MGCRYRKSTDGSQTVPIFDVCSFSTLYNKPIFPYLVGSVSFFLDYYSYPNRDCIFDSPLVFNLLYKRMQERIFKPKSMEGYF